MSDKTTFYKMCHYLLDFENIQDKDLLKEKKNISSITKALKITNKEVYDVIKELESQKILSIPNVNTPMENRSWEINFEKLRAAVETV